MVETEGAPGESVDSLQFSNLRIISRIILNAWKSYFFWCRVCTVPAVVQLFSLISPVFLCRDVILVFLVPCCALVCTVPAVVQHYFL